VFILVVVFKVENTECLQVVFIGRWLLLEKFDVS
jgi:hypothetical protein